MKRNIRNISKTTSSSLLAYGERYSAVKNHFSTKYFHNIKQVYAKGNNIRDDLVKTLKTDPESLPLEVRTLLADLPAKLWKNALSDSIAGLKSAWANLRTSAGTEVSKNLSYTKEEKHYLFYVLKVSDTLHKVINENNSVVEKFKHVDQVKLNKDLNKILRELRFNCPVTHSSSFRLEDTQYLYKEIEGKLFIDISTLASGKRERFELTAHNKLKGTIMIVQKDNHFEIHKPVNLKVTHHPDYEAVIGIDKGYLQLMSTSTENQYGVEFDELMKAKSDKLYKKNQERQKFQVQVKKLKASGDFNKAQKIVENNLGYKKKNEFLRKTKEQIRSVVNHSINQFIEIEKPMKVGVEDLTFVGKSKSSKKQNRYLSSWVKGYLHSRLEFKFNVHSIMLELVNPAYTSELCSQCDCLGNRNGEEFNCPRCKLSIDANINAGKNIRKRMNDHEIALWMPPQMVLGIIKRRMKEQAASTANAPLVA